MARRCYLRRVQGAYRDVWVVHHGRSFELLHEELDSYQAFATRCRKALRRVGVRSDHAFFQVDHGEVWYGVLHFELPRVLREAHIAADRMPKGRWARANRGDWQGVFYNGDRIEMWETTVQRRGTLYRVVEGGWTSIQPGASHFEEVTYVGARCGAVLYAGF